MRVVRTQHGTHMLMKAFAKNGDLKYPNRIEQNTTNKVSFKLKNVDGVCFLDENAWERLAANRKNYDYAEIRVSPQDDQVWSD